MNANMNRRRALQWLGAAGAAACPVCLAKLAKADTSGEHKAPHWSYEGEGAPEHWGSLSPDFKVCDLGLQQSPIDLTASMRAELSPIPVSWTKGEFTILNNGHTIQVNCKSSGSISIEGHDFDLVQFHIHHPSEHKLNGQSFDLEVHFVHKSAEHGLAVLGVFLKPGASNAALQPVFDAMPAEAGQEVPFAGVDLPAAGSPRLLPLQGLANHPALRRGRDLDGVQGPDRGGPGADREVRRPVPDECPPGATPQPPVPAGIGCLTPIFLIPCSWSF
jgi:carbonic anhydrase